MKHKRLNRDLWGFQGFPYYQVRIDNEDFHGMVCLIRLLSGEYQYWDDKRVGRLAVCGEGMTWMQLLPDNQHRVITVKYFPDGTHDTERKLYPSFVNEKYQASVWYVDITDGYYYDKDGTITYIDKYLDVIFTPEGAVSVADRGELEEAYASGELSEESYKAALAEGDSILVELTTDIEATEARCARIREYVEKKLAAENITS